MKTKITYYHECIPVKTWHSNAILRGGPGVMDLPITKFGMGNEAQVMSVWKVRGLWWRIKFMFSGNISIMFRAPTHPPMSVMIGEPVQKEEQK